MAKNKNRQEGRGSTTNTKKSSKKERLLQTPNCHIGIVGSGLAGLSTALAIVRGGRNNNNNNGNSSSSSSVNNNNNDDSSSSFFQGRITIYERDVHISDRKEGYGMTITYDPNSGPLAKLNVLEEVARRDCPSRCHYLFDEGGNVRGYFGNAFYSTENGGDDDCGGGGSGQRGNLRIPRAELRSILLDALMTEAAVCEKNRTASGNNNVIDNIGKNYIAHGAADATDVNEKNHQSPTIVQIAWNSRLVSYEDRPMMEKFDQMHGGRKKINQQTQKPVLLHFEDGSTDEVDLLIGADGVNSVVAKQYLMMPSSSLEKRKSDDSGNGVEGSTQQCDKRGGSFIINNVTIIIIIII